MLRLLVGLGLGIYLGFRYPEFVKRCLDRCNECLGLPHDEIHEDKVE